MSDRENRVCPVELAGTLDNRIRRWFQDPRRILGPCVREGMTVLDVGCGPGFFTLAMARMVGDSGRVIAADLQEGMLEKVRRKVRGTKLSGRITLHRCGQERIGVAGPVDFVLLFYVMHEIPDQPGLFGEVRAMLRPDGRVLVVEPPFHVSRAAFRATLAAARAAGLREVGRPRVLFSKTALLSPR